MSTQVSIAVSLTVIAPSAIEASEGCRRVVVTAPPFAGAISGGRRTRSVVVRTRRQLVAGRDGRCGHVGF